MSYPSLLFFVIASTAAIVARADSAFSLEDWAQLDPQTKLSVTKMFIAMEDTKGHVTIRLSPEYYVHELDVVVENLVRKGDTEDLKSSVGRSTKTIAMMDCDWDDGATDRFNSAQKFFSPAMLENVRQLYPEKYEQLRSGCKTIEIRVPATGTPALIFNVPVTWTVISDKQQTATVIASDASPGKPAKIGAIIGALLRDGRDPDTFVSEANGFLGKKAPDRTEDIHIAGHEGRLYAGVAVDPLVPGRTQMVKQYVARVDDRYIISVVTMLDPNASAATQQFMELIVASAHLKP